MTLRSVRHRSGRWVARTVAYLVALDASCGRCGEAIDPALPGTHADGATIGHRQALALGGTDDLDNLRAEHRRCNLAAGADVDAQPAATIALPWSVS